MQTTDRQLLVSRAEVTNRRCDTSPAGSEIGAGGGAHRRLGVARRFTLVATTVLVVGGAALAGTSATAAAASTVNTAGAAISAALPGMPTARSAASSASSTSQMQDAANWATAEKNSPDPTWSDYFGHPWSGWCEQFVEQAEGFAFQFPSAIANYQWEADNGRIHTDADPPSGALVFYASDNPYGHVAVSIGGGQAIGTEGYDGQRLPVSQYPVVGFVSNYLGWANPIGS